MKPVKWKPILAFVVQTVIYLDVCIVLKSYVNLAKSSEYSRSKYCDEQSVNLPQVFGVQNKIVPWRDKDVENPRCTVIDTLKWGDTVSEHNDENECCLCISDCISIVICQLYISSECIVFIRKFRVNNYDLIMKDQYCTYLQ